MPSVPSATHPGGNQIDRALAKRFAALPDPYEKVRSGTIVTKVSLVFDIEFFELENIGASLDLGGDVLTRSCRVEFAFILKDLDSADSRKHFRETVYERPQRELGALS